MAQAYIINPATMRTRRMEPAQYDMTLKSIYDEVTTIDLPGSVANVLEGDFVLCDGFFGIVDEVDPTKELMTLTCYDIVSLFRRDLLPTTDSAATGIEAFIKRQIDSNYTNVSDVMYRKPYLDVRVLTTTPSDVIPDIEDGVWNIKSFIAKVRRMYGVFTDFTIVGKKLVVTIQQRTPPTHNVVLGTSGYELREESIGSNKIGRITAYAEDTGVTSNWYLLQDGTITRTYTAANRVVGKWETIIVDEAADVEQEVRNTFAENSQSFLVEFATHRQLNFYDNTVIRTPKGDVYRGYISAVRKTSDEKRTIYKTGELRIMLDEKLNIKFGK